jgi:hypothetical protein
MITRVWLDVLGARNGRHPLASSQCRGAPIDASPIADRVIAGQPRGDVHDFPEPADPDRTDGNGDPLPAPIDPAEARLAYVAVTRAQHHLDLGGLSWIHRHPDGNPAAA